MKHPAQCDEVMEQAWFDFRAMSPSRDISNESFTRRRRSRATRHGPTADRPLSFAHTCLPAVRREGLLENGVGATAVPACGARVDGDVPRERARQLEKRLRKNLAAFLEDEIVGNRRDLHGLDGPAREPAAAER